MKIVKHFICLCFLTSTFLFAQDMDYGNSSEAATLCVDIKSNSFTSSAEADNALNEILAVVGAAKRFMLFPCDNIQNAIAYTSPTGLRYILYDPIFMESLVSGDNYWSSMSILAHEVGHHINGHTLRGDISLYESRLKELEADEFAGFVLAKLGADIDVIKEVFYSIGGDGDDTYSTHPNKTRRVNAIIKGFDRARSNTGFTQTKLSTFEDYFYRGLENLENENYNKAIEDFTEALKLEKDYVTYYNRSVAKENLEDYQGSIFDLNRALEIKPDYYPALYNKSYILNEIANDESDHYEAISLSLKALKLTESEIDIYWLSTRLAKSFYEIESFSKAISALKVAMDISNGENKGNDARNLLLFGEIYYELGNIDEAENYFNDAFDLNGENDTYLAVATGEFYTLKQKHDTARLFYEKAYDWAIEIDNSWVMSRLANNAFNIYKTSGSKNFLYDALLYIQEAVEMEDPYGSLYLMYGTYKKEAGINSYCNEWLKAFELGVFGESLNELKIDLISDCGYVNEDFLSSDDYYDMGSEKYSEGDYAEAVDLFNKSYLKSETNSQKKWALYFQARSNEELNLFSTSIDNFKLALNFLDDDGDQYLNQAINKGISRVYLQSTDGLNSSVEFLNKINYLEYYQIFEEDGETLNMSWIDKNRYDISEYFELSIIQVLDYYEGRVEIMPKVLELMGAEKEEAIEAALSLIDFVENIFDDTETPSYINISYKYLRLMINYQYLKNDIKTLKLANDLIKSFPSFFEGYKTRAEVYTKLNNLSSACEDFNTSINFLNSDEYYYMPYIFNGTGNHYQKGYDLKTLSNNINSKIKEICKQ